MASQDQLLDDAWTGDVPIAPPGRMTEEEFVAWCDEDTRAEWVEGEVVMVSPANRKHMSLGRWLVNLLSFFVEHHDLGEVCYEFQVRLPKQRRRRTPDVLFVAKERAAMIQATHVDGPPDLIMEIVSPDSVARDWREKYHEYEAAGVREYWVIDPMAERVEAYLLGNEADGAERRYRRIEDLDGTIRSAMLPGFFLRTAWLWPETRPKLVEALRALGLLGPERAP